MKPYTIFLKLYTFFYPIPKTYTLVFKQSEKKLTKWMHFMIRDYASCRVSPHSVNLSGCPQKMTFRKGAFWGPSELNSFLEQWAVKQDSGRPTS